MLSQTWGASLEMWRETLKKHQCVGDVCLENRCSLLLRIPLGRQASPGILEVCSRGMCQARPTKKKNSNSAQHPCLPPSTSTFTFFSFSLLYIESFPVTCPYLCIYHLHLPFIFPFHHHHFTFAFSCKTFQPSLLLTKTFDLFLIIPPFTFPFFTFHLPPSSTFPSALISYQSPLPFSFCFLPFSLPTFTSHLHLISVPSVFPPHPSPLSFTIDLYIHPSPFLFTFTISPLFVYLPPSPLT